jgi:hypothetical protein
MLKHFFNQIQLTNTLKRKINKKITLFPEKSLYYRPCLFFIQLFLLNNDAISKFQHFKEPPAVQYVERAQQFDQISSNQPSKQPMIENPSIIQPVSVYSNPNSAISLTRHAFYQPSWPRPFIQNGRTQECDEESC